MHENATISLIDELLTEQQRLTPATRFARHHERGELPAQAKYYRDLIPLTQPQRGQQYAFEVDLDRCSGCKACVSACHSLNGLDDGEMWRETGLLVSLDSARPFQQTVTTACHHCLDPGCLNGCPVLAYDKDPFTGIVRHLDDQCIGCQYCVMKCPYDVPKYLPERGIVRKCDMCADRLAVGEPSACVQACPAEAIRIVVVDHADITAAAQRGEFLPAAPQPRYTLPTTRYKSKTPLPAGLVAGDHRDVKPSDAHLPLVFMLVLSQLAVGATIAAAFSRLSTSLLLMASFAGEIAPLVALLHLGKPTKAWRAFLGWRTSWFSREVIAFGAFVPVVSGALLSSFMGSTVPALFLKSVSALTGLIGVACSAMIYVDTRREFWRASQTFGKFFLTTLVLGTAAALAQYGVSVSIAALLVLGMAAKLFLELRPGGNSAGLLAGVLRPAVRLRVVCAALGGLFFPVLLVFGSLRAFAIAAFVFCLIGELFERYLFFTAVAPERMPGGPVA